MTDTKYEIPEGLRGSDLPDVLIPYQQKLLQCTARSPVVVCEKSRRIGMTWAVGSDAVLHAATNRKAGGMDVLYIGFNLDMTREFIDVCAMWAKAFNHACSDMQEFMFKEDDENGDTKEIKAFRISFASGFDIVALSSKPRSLRGRQGYVIIDEAAFHDDLEELMKAALALLIWGGKILVISTHDGVDNPFNRLIQDARAGRNNYKILKVDFKSALNDGLYKRICYVRGLDWSQEAEDEWAAGIRKFYGEGASEELDCIPRKSGGTYLPAQLVEPCMSDDIPVIRYEQTEAFLNLSEENKARTILEFCDEQLGPLLAKLDQTKRHYFGQDFGRSGDLTVWAPLEVMQHLHRRVPFLLELRNIPFEEQKQILFYVIDRLPRFSGGMLDATGIGASTAEAVRLRYGEHLIHEVKINVGWYQDAFPKYRAAYEDKSITVPKDADVLQDHRTAQMLNGVPQIPRNKATDGKPRHGDSLVALAGAYWATLQETYVYGYESATQRSARQDFMRPNTFIDDVKIQSRFGKGCF